MKLWMIINGEPVGPMSLEQAMENGLTPETPVWFDGLEDWVDAGELPELAGCFTPSTAEQAVSCDEEAERNDMPEIPEIPADTVVRGDENVEDAPSFEPYRAWQHVGSQPHHGMPVQERENVPPPMPSTYLVWSVAVTVLCCLIPGIVAIIYSTKVSSKYNRGDYDGAAKCSEMAEWWVMISIVLGLVWAPFQVLVSMMMETI